MWTIRNDSHDPFYNQAFEEYVFQTFRDDGIFFLWQNSPAVVVGSYQNICCEVRVETLRKLGIPVVRRLSGGGTVYHDLGNINYTYIIRQEELVDYDRCLRPVIDALNAIGVPARKNRTCDIAIGSKKSPEAPSVPLGTESCTMGHCCFSLTSRCWTRSLPTTKTNVSGPGGRFPPSVR